MEEYQLLLQEIQACRACPLCQARMHTVPGDGNLNADIMIIGEGPGAEEDKQGLPFVGAAGKLLDQMLDTIGLTREQVYISNIVKCRPPANRVPKPDEVAACIGYLEKQIEMVNPKIIVLLGATALNNWFSKDMRITKVRGQWFEKQGRHVIATFHPAALLRDPRKKPDSFDDFLSIKQKLSEILSVCNNYVI